ncbi:MAG: glycosyl transferase family protein [Pikeienuella sp.]
MTDKGDAIAAQVRAMARGPSRGRNLDRDEARDAMTAILAGDAAPEAVGALFMLMRYRGEVAAEIAGFVDALRMRLSSWRDSGAAVDWPSYAAGRTRGLPLFLLAAKLVARSGRAVLLHGWNSHMTHPVTTAKGAAALGIASVDTPKEARAALASDGIAYVSLTAMDDEILRLLRLRDVLGLRSPLNTALRALNPGGAETSVQGVFHPSYRALQTDAARLLDQPAMGVIKGGGGEFERHPGKGVELYGYNVVGPFDEVMAPLAEERRRMRADDGELTPAMLAALWSGAREDAFARDVVIATAGAALFIAGGCETLARAEAQAAALWSDRHD